MKRYLRPLALILVLVGTPLISLGGACNEGAIKDDTETPDEGSGPSKHPTLPNSGDGVDAAALKGGGGPMVDSLPGTFNYSLRDGSPDAGSKVITPPVKANPLSPADADKLLARLPPIKTEDGDVVDFALREGSKPPPLTGEQLLGVFPPPVAPDVAPPDVSSVKPEVLRSQPEGDVPLAPRITITFSTPMVPLTSHDTLAKSAVPATMKPDIDGLWRWVGTKTLYFDPVGRAPMATDFVVEVPAGVKDALGRPLEKGKKFTFRTPPPSFKSMLPQGEDVKLDPHFLVIFDQRIDSKGALEKVVVKAGSKTMKARALTAEESKADLGNFPEDKDFEGRWVAFRLTEKLPKDTSVTVTFPKGFPSAEGPRVTESDLAYSFKTYGPFKVKEARCGWNNECYPGQPYTFWFTNPIDEDKLEPKQVTVDPAILGFEAEASHANLNLRGMTKGKTTYKVKLDKGIKDIYGQTLEGTTDYEWDVKAARSLMSGNMKPMTVLDPIAKKKRLPVYVMNMDEIEVELYKVEPSQWTAYLQYTQERWRTDKPPVPPGTKVFGKRVKTEAPREELFEVGVDLSPALDGDFGQLIAVIKPTGIEKTWERDRMTVVTWVQATRIGLDAFVDGDNLIAWATGLGDGKALSGVSLELTGATTATSDGNGFATIVLPGSSAKAQTLLAKKDGDLAFLPDNFYGSSSGQWVKRERQDYIRWMVFDDRHLYRPDETVSVKGALRVIEAGNKGDVGLLPAGKVTELSWQAMDSQGNEIAKGKTPVSPLGTFDMTLKLPKTPNLGGANIRFATGLSTPGYEHYHYFEIQEFRRPEFEVGSTVSEGPHIVGGSATVEVKASYFAGGPLPNTEVNWTVSTSPTNFTPPNQDEFIFGEWMPWWGWRGGPDAWNNNYQTFQGRTDGAGVHRLGLDFKSVEPARPTTVTAEATVQDVNRQTWSTATPILVHASKVYVGVKTGRWFVEAGKPIEVQTIAADIDGKRLEGVAITMTSVRLEWKKVKKEWKEVEVDKEECKVVSAKDPVTCKFLPKSGGRHKITAVVEDQEKRKNQTSISVWVPGGDQPADRNLEQETITLIPSKKTYEPGETAEVLVQSPFAPAEGVYLIVREGIVQSVPFKVEKDAVTLKIKIEEWMIPGFSVLVYLNGMADRVGDDGKPNPKLPKRPAFAANSLSIEVPPTLRTLSVVATPKALRIEPGANTAVSVVVKDAAGKPVANAEVAVIVVDEAVLALTGHTYPDPVAAFYSSRGTDMSAWHLKNNVLLAALSELYGAAGNLGAEQVLAEAAEAEGDTRKSSVRREMADGFAGGSPGAPPPMPTAAMAPTEEKPADAPGPASGPIAVRKNFDALAVFFPKGVTDANGKLDVPVKLPDNLTRYRVVAVALSGPKHFGKGENAITARLPLMVRMSPPRFLNFGDRFELPVVLQNQTDAPLEVSLAVRATNATLTQGAGRRVMVPANDRVEVRLPMSAEKPGTARFQAGAMSGGWADAAEVKLPVWTPATTEAFATYGVVDQGGVKQPVVLPDDVVLAFGGLEVQTSSTQLQALTDAVVYLVTYPYECSEQIASRMMSLAALKDVLTAFKAEGLPSPAVLIASVDEDIKRLRGMQGDNGGFAFWRRDQEAWPFLTVHVTHALLRAKEKGFVVPEDMIQRALGYLKNIRNHMTQEWYTEGYKRTIESFALYVRNRAGDVDGARAKKILSEEGGTDKANLELVGWLYPVFQAAKDEATLANIRKHLNNRVSETAGAAHFVTSYGDGAYLLLHSDRRVDGLLLEGLIGDQPKSDLIPKLVRGLLGHKKGGRWQSTQENAWVLLGLDLYFNVFEKDEPNFKASTWLGNLFAGSHTFKGRTTERHNIEIPMQKLADLGGSSDLIIAKEGIGRMYYRFGMKYAPKSLKLAPSNHGFHVERLYESVDNKDDVTKDAEGRWVIKAGARVKVKLTMHTEDRRYHVALVDPMPAGLESLNPELKGTQATPGRDDDRTGGAWDTGTLGRGRYSWWWGPWYEHENLRDERAEAFTPLLWEGVYTYTYFARATTPGEFVVPPPKAEEMYTPETFGRGASDVVIVK